MQMFELSSFADCPANMALEYGVITPRMSLSLWVMRFRLRSRFAFCDLLIGSTYDSLNEEVSARYLIVGSGIIYKCSVSNGFTVTVFGPGFFPERTCLGFVAQDFAISLPPLRCFDCASKFELFEPA